MNLQYGSVLPMKSMKIVIQDGQGHLEYKAPKGKQFVLLLMGVEDINSENKINADEFLKSMGWEFKND